MAQISISGWRPGANTVHALKAIRDEANVPLNEAHALVTRVLNGETVVLLLRVNSKAENLAIRLRGLGLLAEVVGES
jgi:hypothetical protein